MFEVSTILLLLLIIPTCGAFLVALLGNNQTPVTRVVSLVVVLANLILSIVVATAYYNEPNPTPDSLDKPGVTSKPSFTEYNTFYPRFVPGAIVSEEANELEPVRTSYKMIDLGMFGSVDFYLGVDGLNVWLIVLTSLLMVSGVLISWTSVTERTNEYYAWLLLLGTAMMGVFLAFDIILFYVFFELTLVPLFFLIGIWGGPERRAAARKFFIYTLVGSVITLLGVLAVVVVCYDNSPLFTSPPNVGVNEPIQKAETAHSLTFSIPELVRRINYLFDHSYTVSYWLTFQTLVFLLLLAGFAIKVPLVPVHTWLPLAHVEAPTAGSVLLAGVLLKVGSYGILRLCIPLAPDACIDLGLQLLGPLAVIGILYGAFCALAQDDIKKLVAYSSVSHMGFCILGMFALNESGLTGSLMQMINHGLSTGALFLLVGMMYERYHTRKLADYGGIASRLYFISFSMVFVCLTSVGLPGLNGFVGEALVFFGMFRVNATYAVIGTGGIVLGAWYLLNMLRQVFFGPVKEPKVPGSETILDMNFREWVALGPIMVLCLVLGVYPQPVINTAAPDIKVISNVIAHRRNVRPQESQVAQTEDTKVTLDKVRVER
ncbi:MAG: NuoM family protein [Gemmataceae bacterium]